jgi:hypothetical protein
MVASTASTSHERLVAAGQHYRELLEGFIEQLDRFRDEYKGLGPVELEVLSLRVVLARYRHGFAGPEADS